MAGIVMLWLPADAPTAEQIEGLLSGTFNPVHHPVGTQNDAEKTLADADMVLVVVGQNFAQNLHDAPDVVRILSYTLSLTQTPTLTLMLDGAKLHAEDFPPELKPLAYLNSMSVTSGVLFHRELADAAREIAAVLEQSGADFDSLVISPSIRKSIAERRRRVPVNLFMMSAIFACALTLLFLPQVENNALRSLPPTTTPSASNTNVSDLYIGFAGDLSRDTQTVGQAMLNGVQLALTEHESLTVDGEAVTVDLLTQDSACSAGTAITVAENFTASPNLVGVIGDSCDAACAVTVPIYDAAGLPNLTPACANPDLSAPTFSRVVPPSTAEPIAVADFLYELVGTDAALIYDEQRHSLQFSPVFQARYEALGGELSTVYGTDSATIDYDLLVDIVLGNNPSAIYYMGRAVNAAEVRVRLVELGAGDIPFVVSILGDVSAFSTRAGDAADGALMVRILPPELPQAFIDRYTAAYGEAPSAVAAYAYDATNLLLDGIAQVATLEADGVQVDPSALQDAIRAYEGEGVTGPMACDPAGNCVTANTAVYVVQGGELIAR